MSEIIIREPKNSTSTANANELYNSLSESNKAMILAMLNMMVALLEGVKQVQEHAKSA